MERELGLQPPVKRKGNYKHMLQKYPFKIFLVTAYHGLKKILSGVPNIAGALNYSLFSLYVDPALVIMSHLGTLSTTY